MKFLPCTFGLSLIAVFLTVQTSEAKDLPIKGLLDEMPKNCSNLDYCLDPHNNYPYEKINEILTKKYHFMLGNVHEEPSHRQGIDTENQNDCEKDVTYGPIYEIKDKNGNIRVVVQSKGMFEQQLRIERCLYPERLLSEQGTEHFSPTELESNNIQCKDKKLHYNFLVLTRDGEGIESVKSKDGIPVCCSCRVEQ